MNKSLLFLSLVTLYSCKDKIVEDPCPVLSDCAFHFQETYTVLNESTAEFYMAFGVETWIGSACTGCERITSTDYQFLIPPDTLITISYDISDGRYSGQHRIYTLDNSWSRQIRYNEDYEFTIKPDTCIVRGIENKILNIANSDFTTDLLVGKWRKVEEDGQDYTQQLAFSITVEYKSTGHREACTELDSSNNICFAGTWSWQDVNQSTIITTEEGTEEGIFTMGKFEIDILDETRLEGIVSDKASCIYKELKFIKVI